MISIRPAGINDSEIIADVGSRSFQDAFGENNSPADMQKYLLEKFSIENIKKEISDVNAKFFIAYYNEIPAGYLKMVKSDVPAEIKEKNPVELQRIYVLKEYYDKKIGKELMHICTRYAIENNFDSVWLGVWQHNNKAVEFYKRWGFEIIGTRNFKLGNDIKEDYLMVKVL
jgi:ribosomal protein S18 acetylase RimI-like enzyme